MSRSVLARLFSPVSERFVLAMPVLAGPDRGRVVPIVCVLAVFAWLALTITHPPVADAGIIAPADFDAIGRRPINDAPLWMSPDLDSLVGVSIAPLVEAPEPAAPAVPEIPKPATSAVGFDDFLDAKTSAPITPATGAEAEAPAALDTAVHHLAVAHTSQQQTLCNDLYPNAPAPDELLDPPRFRMAR